MKNPIELFANEVLDLEQRGLLEVTEERIKLTKKGRLLGNEVFQVFLGICND